MLEKSAPSQRDKVLDYSDMLRVACCKASEGSTSHLTLNVHDCSDVALLEKELQKQGTKPIHAWINFALPV